MQLNNVSRIIVEDYPKEQRETVAKLANILNLFMDQVVELSQKNINFDNLNRSVVTLDVTVNASGVPQGVSQVRTGLKTYRGQNIIGVQSLATNSPNVVSAPYIDITPQASGIVKINKIYGLPAGVKCRVTVEFIG